MCIIIDANTLPEVFDESNSDHENFKPVYEWIRNEEGKVVLGGTSYLRELQKMPSYLSIIKQFDKARKVVIINQDKVDDEEDIVKSIHGNGSKKFDDKHIVAIIRASGCKLLCSNDSTSDSYIKNSKYYRSSTDRPSIYRSLEHEHLLCEANIAPCCKPSSEPDSSQEKILKQV